MKLFDSSTLCKWKQLKKNRGRIGRGNEPSFSESVTNKKIVATIRQTDSTTCPIGNQKCLLSDPTTSHCNSESDKECLESNNKITKIFCNLKFNMLLQYTKECMGFIALILTTYATLLTKDPVDGTTSPEPIFSQHSIVQEWPYGNLVDVQSKVAVSELSLIYFYAPWCAESLNAKQIYNFVANLYSEEVYFAAVNCWQPNSGCRTLYPNVYKWPVLMAYLPNALSVKYNGDWSFNSLSKFIDGLLVPIIRIHNKNELLHLRITNDGVIFGLFNSCDTKEFQVFFHSAIKWLENNSYQNTKFAVFIGKDTSKFLYSELTQAPVMKLFTPNDTIIYSKRWTSKNIIHFLKHQLAESSIWVSLPGVKSAKMYTYLQRGPVLIMFSPKVSPSNHYLIMKQLMYSYNNYQIDINNSVLNKYISEIKKEYPVMLKNLKKKCDFSNKIQRQIVETDLLGARLWGDSLFSVHKINASTYRQHIDVVNKNKANYCEENFNQNLCFQRNTGKLDNQTPSEILRRRIQKQCLNTEKTFNQLVEKGDLEPISFIQLTNNEHKNNRTLKLMMLDSMVHYDYLRNFMGDFKMSELSSLTTSKLLIIDNEREALHLQKGPVSTRTALEFVNEFYHGKLSRHFRSSQTGTKNNLSDNSLIRIKDINSRQFKKVLNRKNVTSVLLFYTPQCSLCYIMSQALLYISHVIKLRQVKFYRIDASANEMCWEYTMDKFPKLIIFPKNRSGDSNVFLSSLKISVKNVLSFILANLNPEQKLQSLINACMLTKLSFAFQTCVSQARGMISNEIGHQLQKCNHPLTIRAQVLTRLKALKSIYMELLRARKTEDLTFISKEISNYGNIK